MRSAWTHGSCDNHCGLSSCGRKTIYCSGFKVTGCEDTHLKEAISVLNEGVSVESKCLIVHVFAIHEDEHSVQGVDTIFSRSNCEESANLSDQTYVFSMHI